ncbi:VOC family protein [Salipiger sp. H15]|uniref:VOC family protein n=1 Tax=Alloyangia sp. H15 TaxID=3029062 RepID=A0AAU8AK81_9RHOB
MKLHAITIDTSDPQRLAAWWSEALRIPMGMDYGMIVQLGTSASIPPIQFQKIEDVPEQRNRVHFDLKASDLDRETARLVSLGATVLKEIALPEIRFTSFADPDGNFFDVVQE